MTSLCPGSVFSTVGFNRKSTPTPPAITPAELDQKYARNEHRFDIVSDAGSNMVFDLGHIPFLKILKYI
ncbi:hypothetical protein KUTeg_009483 [Tegillarca granosa]|uniref:Uncharacterized protein n=1 Tax=Tegillarca granosa TaxID=220873 RepID=A0ABQ9F3Z4_TEGGR|nr:hypothetical protein KUTeg_009483 [Tegillarca granosa]